MNIRAEITRKPLEARGVTAPDPEPGCGAVVEFAGVVRGEEDGDVISALDYEAYEAMACSEMERIARDLSAGHPCRSLHAIHRVGRVPAGEASIVVRIEAKHRAEAFAMLEAFMERLKRDVPVWKRPAK